ncbi:hypothetical protein BDY21DRAFT_337897 [Lineolata rhizophorae]|uniref:NAD-dependent epimerase/dehydratase domain-containing protein n=1 Tax=Lineolata rhizophorae TaxID=578093 RepID=A0A6A6P5M8_9PEZI|nr:hypothetical protein BDY21DRAFT_337897 [Lineolata rhizophorae]
MANPNHNNLVLITGCTGHIGFSTLLSALRAGHRVRAAVRSSSKASALLSHPVLRPYTSRLTTAVVPDLTAPGAYRSAVRGTTHVIHIASPLTTGAPYSWEHAQKTFIQPAVRGTLELLEAARAEPRVRRVVITSSMVALVPLAQLEGRERRPASAGPVRPTDRIPLKPEPYETEFAAYAASKVAALREAEAFMARDPRPHFDVVHVHPSFVLGRNGMAAEPRASLRGTNGIALGMALGRHLGNVAGASAHVEDVAAVHVKALDAAAVPGGRSYIVSQRTRWEDVAATVRRRFADAVQKRLLVPTGSADTLDIELDASETEAIFGFAHRGIEDQVESVVGQYLELRAQKRAGMRKGAGGDQPRKAVGTCQQVGVNA